MNPASISSTPCSRTDAISAPSARSLARPGDSASSPTRAPDRVELSDEARRAAEDPRPVRLDLVTRIREEIARGGYESPEKIAIAAHEMTQALNEQA